MIQRFHLVLENKIVKCSSYPHAVLWYSAPRLDMPTPVANQIPESLQLTGNLLCICLVFQLLKPVSWNLCIYHYGLSCNSDAVYVT
jgi:hypothetical protein